MLVHQNNLWFRCNPRLRQPVAPYTQHSKNPVAPYGERAKKTVVPLKISRSRIPIIIDWSLSIYDFQCRNYAIRIAFFSDI